MIGGNRIPFARSNSAYAKASNQDMLTAALDGLVARFGLEGERLGEVAAGAVLKHSRDFNLTRECVLGSRLAPETPAYDVQQACGTGLEAVMLVANKIALGQIDAGVAGGVDTTSDAPIGAQRGPAPGAAGGQPPRSRSARGLRLLTKLRPTQIVPAIPRNEEPRTGLSMGEHQALTAAEWGITREEQDELAARQPPEPRRRLRARLLRRPGHALPRASSATRTCAPDASTEKLAKLKPVFGGEEGTMTAGNSTPLSDGAAVVLLATEEWAAERGLPVLATFVTGETAAVDYVHGGEGLLMAPAYAMPRMLARAGLTLQDFDLYEIHEAFASQVLSHAEGVGGPGVLHATAWAGRAARRRSTARKLNVNGGSLAAGHPFAATGGRIVAGLAKALARARRGPRRDQRLRRRRPGRRRRSSRRRRRDRQLHEDRQLAARPPGRAAGRAAPAGASSSATSPGRRWSTGWCCSAPRRAAGSRRRDRERLLDAAGVDA